MTTTTHHRPSAGRTTITDGSDARCLELADELVRFLETGIAPDGLFADDVFCDFTLPLWRLQAQGRDDAIGLRMAGHPGVGRVPRTRFDLTSTGFLLEVEEEWEADGTSYYCRELMRCDVDDDGSVSEIAVYCTGDWPADQVARHAEAVTLIRP